MPNSWGGNACLWRAWEKCLKDPWQNFQMKLKQTSLWKAAVLPFQSIRRLFMCQTWCINQLSCFQIFWNFCVNVKTSSQWAYGQEWEYNNLSDSEWSTLNASRTKRGSVFSFFTVRNVAVGVYFEDDGVLRSFGLCFWQTFCQFEV